MRDRHQIVGKSQLLVIQTFPEDLSRPVIQDRIRKGINALFPGGLLPGSADRLCDPDKTCSTRLSVCPC